MSDVQLGNLAPESAKRDAVHVAVVPVVAGEDLKPGTHVALCEHGEARKSAKAIGVVDPFVEPMIRKGERFYLCLYPRTVVGLRHHYLHPALDGDEATEAAKKLGFPEPQDFAQRELSRAWIEQWAASEDIGYDELMFEAGSWIETGDYWNEGERFDGVVLPNEFWDHYDRVMNKCTPEDRRHSFFSCAC